MRLLALAVLLSSCATVPVTPPELRDIRQLTSDGTHAESYFSYD